MANVSWFLLWFGTLCLGTLVAPKVDLPFWQSIVWRGLVAAQTVFLLRGLELMRFK
jgi:hypothetical protein